jgi:peptidoglycan hydrolase CwlO-like protein
MMMTANHNTSLECLHEEQIQAQSRKIERLEAHSDFKERRIDELNSKMDKLNDKFDKVLEGFNELKIESKSDDSELELRLQSIETKQQAFEEKIEEDKKESRIRINRILTIFGLGLTVLTIVLSILFNSHIL